MSESGEGPVGRIFEIQRFSIHDGPGIRTTVFLKGCPLRCAWCHNPEGADREVEISFIPEKCIGCGYCFRACPQGAHQMQDERHVLERERCVRCGTCVAECWAGALERVGRDATVDEVMREVLSDKPFYETSGGGLTVSGGEPMAQIDFTEAFLRRATAEGLHVCMETCGFAPWQDYERIVPLVDLFFYDIKETDEALHREFTGVPLAPILENLKNLHAAGATIRLRLPIVPGFNDRDEHFRTVADLAASLPDLESVEVMPYHRLGSNKDQRLGHEVRVNLPEESATREVSQGWVERLRELGAPVVNMPTDTP